MERRVELRNYKRAFDCGNCPGRGDEEGCPWWWAIVEEDREAREQRLSERCGVNEVPRFLNEIMANATQGAAAVESFREELLQVLSLAGARPVNRPSLLERGQRLLGIGQRRRDDDHP